MHYVTATDAVPRVEWRTPAPLELSPILTCALDAFYENGYHGTSVRDIARRVGLTVSALYYHHENKEAVLQALLDRSIERVTELCSAALADAGDDPQARFCNLVECLVLFMTMSTRTAHLDHEMRSLPAESLRVYSTKRRRIESMMVQAVEAGVSANVFEVARPNRAGRALLGMVQSIASWYHPDGPVSPQELAHDYVNIALHTVGARAEVIAGVLSSG